MGSMSMIDRRAAADRRQAGGWERRCDRRGCAAGCAAVSVGRFLGFDEARRPLVSDLPGVPRTAALARTTVPLARAAPGAEVLVIFEGNDPKRPIIVGILQASRPAPTEVCLAPEEVAVCLDNGRHVISAERELRLQCGEASITLTRAGKVIISGNYVVSRSTGYNKIKGAAVDIN